MDSYSPQSKPDWFDLMPTDFYRLTTDVVEPLGLSLQLSKGIDLAVRTVLTSVISAASIPAGYSGEKIVADIDTLLSKGQADEGSEPYSLPLITQNFTIKRTCRR